jgi:ATP-dependent DNA ligase
VIIHRGKSLVQVPLETRRELLSDVTADLKMRTPLLGFSDTLDTTPAELIPLVKEFGFEDIIAKRKDSCYEAGQRSGAWVKYKVKQSSRVRDRRIYARQSAGRADCRLLRRRQADVCQQGAERLCPAVEARGMAEVERLRDRHLPVCQLPEKKRTQWALTREEMKNCVWLKSQLLAQIEFTEWTPDGHLRHSKFCGLREMIKSRMRWCGRNEA